MRVVLDIRLFLFVFLALVVCGTATWIINSVHFMKAPDALAFAITADLTIALPAFFYIFVVRRKRLPAITLVPVFILSIVMAGFILPATQQTHLDLVKKLVPLLELVVLGFIIVKIRTIAKNFHAIKQHEIYFIDALGESCKRALGNLPILGIILTEFSLLYFAFAGWFKKFENFDSNNIPFSYHHKSGYAAIAGVIVMALVTETLALHLLLRHWSPLAAWIFTGLSVYGLFWLLGDYHAMRLHPIVLSRNVLFIRTGLRWRASIPFAEIAALQKFNTKEKSADVYLSLAVFGDPRLVIHCKQPVLVEGLFGIKREITQLGVTVDDEKLFMETLQQRLNVK